MLRFWVILPVLLCRGWGQEVEITRASDVRVLSETEAKSHKAVRLRGVVTLPPNPRGSSFVIDDDSAAIYCEGAAEMMDGLKRGDLVEVTGHSSMGGFAPFVVVDTMGVVGIGAIPQPIPVSFDQMLSGSFGSRWVEVSGIVRRSEDPGNPVKAWMLELATGGGRLKILFRDPLSGRHPVDAEIRVAGICFYQFSRSGHAINPLLVVPSGVVVDVVEPPPAEVPVRGINRLISFGSRDFGHRVRVSGVVTYHLPGEGFWFEEDGGGLRVILSDDIHLSPGEKIEVTGFPVMGNYSPELEDVTVKRQEQIVPTPPTVLGSTLEALDHDATLISLKATLIEQSRVPRGLRLLLRDQDGDFSAYLRVDNDARNTPIWETGSEILVTGICQVSLPPPGSAPGTIVPRGFELILRSPAEVKILRTPPWWNAERRARLLAITTVALGVVIGFVILMARRRLRQSAAARKQSEAEFSAILAERNRIAREIHDTLAQDLGAISLHLELVRKQLPPDSDAAVHLAEARGLTRGSLREARNSIWNMRSQVLETHDLAEALAGILDQLTVIDGIHGRFLVTGSRYRLPPVTENNLLRIGQEAITNAVKHAKAKHIEVILGFSAREVTLRVKDDGCGFDSGKDASDKSHFGLKGLRERAHELGATIRIESTPSLGTEVILNVPVAPVSTH